MMRKIVLTTLACSLLLAYGYYQTRLNAHIAGSPRNFRPDLVDVGVSAPAGAVFVRSYESQVNGSPARFAHYVHSYDAERVVEEFVVRYPAAGEQNIVPHLIQSAGCAAAGFIDGSHFVAVIAIDVPGGSSFFVTRAPAESFAEKTSPDRDVPGTDVPGVPRPMNAIRRMSVENLGGIESVLAFYEGWGDIDSQVFHLRNGMRSQGWKESVRASDLMSAGSRGEMLSFSKGTKHCFIYCEKEPRTGIMTTVVLYRVKDWLPPQAAYR